MIHLGVKLLLRYVSVTLSTNLTYDEVDIQIEKLHHITYLIGTIENYERFSKRS